MFGIASLVSAALMSPQTETMGTIDRADPRFDKIVPKDSQIIKLDTGFSWAEGPVWVPFDGGMLVFSDVPNNVVHSYKPGSPKVNVFLKPAGFTGSPARGGESGSNGLAVDADAHLILCQHGDRRVARLERDGTFKTLADRYQGKRFNSPNDLAIHSNGEIYFTDPPYGLEKGMADPKKELPFQGVYRIKKDGSVELLTDKLSRPNGIAFSPDEKTLYVAISDGARPVIMAYDVTADGKISQERVFFDTSKWMKQGLKGAPDGMKVAADGTIFATGPGGVFVLSPKGEYLGRIDPGCATANCGFGEGGTVLYMTADKSLCKIKTNVKGRGF